MLYLLINYPRAVFFIHWGLVQLTMEDGENHGRSPKKWGKTHW